MAHSIAADQVAAQKRRVRLRAVLLGALMCVLLGVAIPYFDIIRPTSELGGCHFPVGPIFFFTFIILFMNVPVKAFGRIGNVISGGVLGLAIGVVSACRTQGITGFRSGLFTGVIIAAALIAVLSLLLGKDPLNARELLVIFSMMLIASGIPTFGLINQLLPMLTSWQYLAADQGWEPIFNHIPEWLVVGDPAHMAQAVTDGTAYSEVGDTYYLSIKWFYEKLPEGAQVPWHDWVHPIITWSIFVALLYSFMFFLTSILRKQWVEKEKLLFPLMQLPVEMARSEDEPGVISPLFRSPLLIAGFCVPFLIYLVMQLKHYVISPLVINPMKQSASPFVDTSLQAFGRFPVFVYFAVIGFCYLLSTEITLSVWLFWVINRFQRVLVDWSGQPSLIGEDPNAVGAAQFNGALIVFVLFGLYAARGHLLQVFRKAVLGDKTIDDSEELVGYRSSLSGLVLTGVGLVVWCMCLGVTAWVAVAILFFFTISIIGITRAVAECGLLFVKIESGKPTDFLMALSGSRGISGVSLTVIGFIQYVSMFDLKTLLMPAMMHGCKARATVNDRSKKMLLGFILAVVIVIAVSGAATMWGCYYYRGGNNIHSWYYVGGPKIYCMDLVKGWIEHPEGPHAQRIWFMIGGGVVTGFLIFMRRSFMWWPLHPLGYIMSNGYFESNRVAFSFFLGWLVKWLILRFGGGRWFKKLRPFFLGLILGHFGSAGLWIVVGYVLDKPAPGIFP